MFATQPAGHWPNRDPLSLDGVERPFRPAKPRPRAIVRRQKRDHPVRFPDGTPGLITAQYLPAIPGADPDADGIAGSSNGTTLYRWYRVHQGWRRATSPRRIGIEPLGVTKTIGDHRETCPDLSALDITTTASTKGAVA